MHIWHRLSLLWGLLLDLSPTTTALSAICVLIFFLSVLGIELGATHLLDKLYHLSHVPSPVFCVEINSLELKILCVI
jgi:hypothetical protein